MDIHFTVSDAADPGIYQMGMFVTAMKTKSGKDVSGQIFRNNETAAIIVQAKDVEPTVPQEKYNVLFPKGSVKQGGSAELKVSFMHGSTPKLVKEIKAGSYTCGDLSFTWKDMTFEDTGLNTLYLPVTVTAAANAATGRQRYTIDFDNVLVNEDGNTIPLSAMYYSMSGSISVDENTNP